MRKILILLMVACSTMCYAILPPRASRPLHRVGAHWYKGNDYLQMQEQYEVNYRQWNAVLDWISVSGVQYMPAGKYYVQCEGGDSILVKIQDAETRDESQIEAHVQYIDLQWTIRGVETYEKYEDMRGLEATDAYNSKKDVQHFREKTDEKSQKHIRRTHTVITSDPSTVYLFFPGEPHKAMLKSTTTMPIRKVVAKIPYIRK